MKTFCGLFPRLPSCTKQETARCKSSNMRSTRQIRRLRQPAGHCPRQAPGCDRARDVLGDRRRTSGEAQECSAIMHRASAIVGCSGTAARASFTSTSTSRAGRCPGACIQSFSPLAGPTGRPGRARRRPPRRAPREPLRDHHPHSAEQIPHTHRRALPQDRNRDQKNPMGTRRKPYRGQPEAEVQAAMLAGIGCECVVRRVEIGASSRSS